MLIRTSKTRWRSQRGYVLVGGTASDYWTAQPTWWAPTTTFGTVAATVSSGGNLQATIDSVAAAATSGQHLVIRLERGATFSGEFKLKPHSAANITICTTGIEDSSYAFPAYGETMTPDHASASALATLVTTGSGITNPTLWIPHGAGRWSLRGLKIAPTATTQDYAIVLIGKDTSDISSFGTDWNSVVTQVFFDRVLMQIPTAHRFRNNSPAVLVTGRNIKFRGCYLEVYDVKTDYKAFEVQYADNVQFEDGTIWGGSETVFLGGGGTGDLYALSSVLPRNMIFRRSVIGKDHIQQKLDGWASKNVLETKMMNNAWFEGCWITQNADTAADNGQANLIASVHYPMSTTGGGYDPSYAHVDNWSFTDCVIGDAYQLFSGRGYYGGEGGNPQQPVANQIGSQRLSFDNCLLHRFNGPSYLNVLYTGWRGVRLRHVTFDGRQWDGTERYPALLLDASPYYYDQQTPTTVLTQPMVHFEWTDSVFAGFSGKLLDDNNPRYVPLGINQYLYNQGFYDAYLTASSNTLARNLWTSVDNYDTQNAGSGWGFTPKFGTTDGADNWRRVIANATTTAFTDPSTKDYRLAAGMSAYKAGGARQASDGKDLGVDFTQMATTMGTRVWDAVGFPF